MEDKLMWRQGNLYTGYPFAVQVEEQFGSTEIHGPFSGENEAHTYGMLLARESDGTKSYVVVKLETPYFGPIATAEEIREHLKSLVAPK